MDDAREESKLKEEEVRYSNFNLHEILEVMEKSEENENTGNNFNFQLEAEQTRVSDEEIITLPKRTKILRRMQHSTKFEVNKERVVTHITRITRKLQAKYNYKEI